MEVGGRFAYRERAHTPGDPVRPVEVVKEGPPRSQKIRIRWLDGEYEGLEEWVPKVRLVAPWEQAEALLEDEHRMFSALEASGDVYGSVPYKAVEIVFFAIPSEPGEEVSGHKAMEREVLIIEDLDAASVNLGLSADELLAEPHSYVDRFGAYKAPFGVAVKVAQHCCTRFVREVLRYLKAEEDELRQELITGDRTRVAAWSAASEAYRKRAEARLQELEPIFALIREWCGKDSVEEFDQVLELRKEVDRLRELVKDTARWLRDTGHPLKASLLLKELDSSSESRQR